MSEKDQIKVHENPTPEAVMEMIAANFARFAKHMAFGTVMDMEDFGERTEALEILKDAVMQLHDELECLRLSDEAMEEALELVDAAILATDAKKH